MVLSMLRPLVFPFVVWPLQELGVRLGGPAQRPARRPGLWAAPKPREAMAGPTQADQILSQARDCCSLKEVAGLLTNLQCLWLRTGRLLATPPCWE